MTQPGGGTGGEARGRGRGGFLPFPVQTIVPTNLHIGTGNYYWCPSWNWLVPFQVRHFWLWACSPEQVHIQYVYRYPIHALTVKRLFDCLHTEYMLSVYVYKTTADRESRLIVYHSHDLIIKQRKLKNDEGCWIKILKQSYRKRGSVVIYLQVKKCKFILGNHIWQVYIMTVTMEHLQNTNTFD